MVLFRLFDRDDPWGKNYEEEEEKPPERDREEHPAEQPKLRFADFGFNGTVLEPDQPSYEDWRVKELDDITRSTYDRHYADPNDPARTREWGARYEAYQQGKDEAQQRERANAPDQSPPSPTKPSRNLISRAIDRLSDINEGTLSPENLDNLQEELRDIFDPWYMVTPSEEPEPFQERFIARDDHSLTDTTTGEIIEREESVWEPVPKPEMYVESIQVSEDGGTGEIVFGYTNKTDDGSWWNPFGSFGPDSAEDNQEGDDDQDDESGDDDDDEAGDTWRLI